MVKTVERIVDPNDVNPKMKDLFKVKDFLYKIPENKNYLEFIQLRFKQLKESPKYDIILNSSISRSFHKS